MPDRDWSEEEVIDALGWGEAMLSGRWQPSGRRRMEILLTLAREGAAWREREVVAWHLQCPQCDYVLVTKDPESAQAGFGYCRYCGETEGWNVATIRSPLIAGDPVEVGDG